MKSKSLIALVAVISTMAIASEASARWDGRHGYPHHGYYRSGSSISINFGSPSYGYSYGPPVYYAPRPVVYSPPPAYYYPPPAYYYPTHTRIVRGPRYGWR